jgi:hypothetical protein
VKALVDQEGEQVRGHLRRECAARR